MSTISVFKGYLIGFSVGATVILLHACCAHDVPRIGLVTCVFALINGLIFGKMTKECSDWKEMYKAVCRPSTLAFVEQLQVDRTNGTNEAKYEDTNFTQKTSTSAEDVRDYIVANCSGDSRTFSQANEIAQLGAIAPEMLEVLRMLPKSGSSTRLTKASIMRVCAVEIRSLRVPILIHTSIMFVAVWGSGITPTWSWMLISLGYGLFISYVTKQPPVRV